MTSSSAPTTYSITLDNNIGIIAQEVSNFSDTIVISSSDITSNVLVGSGGSGEYIVDWQWDSQDWINSFPDWNSVQQMCEKYPGLKIAFEKFKTSYYLVKDDWEQKQRKQK